MSVVSGDLVFYGSLMMPTGDSVIIGSGIDLTTRVVFDNPNAISGWGSAFTPAVSYAVLKSDSALDVGQTGYVWGRNAPGVTGMDTLVLAGVTPVTGTNLWQRILMVQITGGGNPIHTGNIILCDTGLPPNTGLILQPSGSGAAGLNSNVYCVNTCRRPFWNTTSNPSAPVSYWDKIFVRNNNSGLALSNFSIQEMADVIGDMSYYVENVYNGTGIATNRQTAPTGTGSYFGSGIGGQSTITPVGLPNGNNLYNGSGLGIWLNLNLPTNAQAINSLYTLQISGSTT